MLPDGSVLNDRAAQKVRRQEQGHEYVEQRLIALGARVPRVGQDPAGWLRQVLEEVGARRLRHAGDCLVSEVPRRGVVHGQLACCWRAVDAIIEPVGTTSIVLVA
jgi:hypothetical protein